MWYVALLFHCFSFQIQFDSSNNTVSFYDFLVCDLVNCALPEGPRCEDGQTIVLRNPGECQPIHECGMLFKHSL